MAVEDCNDADRRLSPTGLRLTMLAVENRPSLFEYGRMVRDADVDAARALTIIGAWLDGMNGIGGTGLLSTVAAIVVGLLLTVVA